MTTQPTSERHDFMLTKAMAAAIAVAAFVLGGAAHAIYSRPVHLPRPASVWFSSTSDNRPYQAVYWFCDGKKGDASVDCPIDWHASTHTLDPDKRYTRAPKQR